MPEVVRPEASVKAMTPNLAGRDGPAPDRGEAWVTKPSFSHRSKQSVAKRLGQAWETTTSTVARLRRRPPAISINVNTHYGTCCGWVVPAETVAFA